MPDDQLRDRLQTSLGTAITIERPLDGDGRAFVARDTTRDRDVVIKVLAPDLAGRVDFARFKREIDFAGRLEDPTIVPLLSAGEVDGVPYVTMPFIRGESLATRLRRDGEIPIDDALYILRDVAKALAHAHGRGVLHRALTQDNVLLLSKDVAMVADLGVVRAVDAATGASPEPTVDNRSDIYAFGVLGYEVLTGVPPNVTATSAASSGAVAPVAPLTPIRDKREGVPSALAGLIMLCLEKRPDDRPQTAGEIEHAIDEIISPSGGLLERFWPSASETVVERSDYYRNRGIMALAAIAVLAIIAGFLTWRSSVRATEGPSAPPPTKAIAVLPLADDRGDSTTQYFADGMTNEISAAISKLPGAQIPSGSATATALRLTGGDRKKASDLLQVDALLEGHLSRSGGRVSLAAQLVDASSGKMLWSKTYTGDNTTAGGVFDVEDSVAHAVAGALHIALGPTRQRLAARGTTSAKAHDLYLLARFTQRTHTETGLRQAAYLFQRAATEDPHYAAAFAGVAESWQMLSDDFISPKEALPHLSTAVARGLAIDSTNASLRFSEGLVAYLFQRDTRTAQAYMSHALALDPDLPAGTKWYPQVLWTNGLADTAKAFLRRAVNRDSTSPDKMNDAWSYAHHAGNALEELEYCGKLAQLHVATRCNALQELAIGNPDDAVTLAQSAAKSAGPRDVQTQLDYVEVLVAANRLDDAHKLVAAVDQQAAAPGSYMREDDIALMHGLIADTSGAMRWFARAASSGSAGIGALYWRTATNPLRKAPQLAAFAKQAGLQPPPSYWP